MSLSRRRVLDVWLSAEKNKEIELIWAILQQNIEKLYILDQIKKSI